MPTPTPTPAAVIGAEAVTVRQFYNASDGNNLQPAFQAALDSASSRRLRHVVNDIDAAVAQMWCPARRTGSDTSADGIPLVVREPVTIDFRHIHLRLMGPGGRNRMIGQEPVGASQPWLGGWMNVVGHPGFDLIAIENVSVDGGFAGDVQTNRDSNVTDKGFRVQDTEVRRVMMRNVELRNFAGEIYYIGGEGPDLQEVEGCHFHGSPQAAWNPGGLGKVVATNLRAGRAYQVAEVLGGAGHIYEGGTFYDSGAGGASFYGGPSPEFLSGYPYNYAYWDGIGEKPWIEFKGTVFDRTPAVRLHSWSRGTIRTRDTPVWFQYLVGHLRDVDLRVESQVDEFSGIEAIGLFGPPNLQTQVGGAPTGTLFKAPSQMALRVNCTQSAAAAAAGRSHAAAVRYFGGVIDGRSVSLEITGAARKAYEEFAAPVPGYVEPSITTSGFRAGG